ncbi:MAG: SprB repeat-containing protein, partial [Bacteroidota bacterium]
MITHLKRHFARAVVGNRCRKRAFRWRWLALFIGGWLGTAATVRAQPCSASLSAVIQDVSCFGGNNGAITVLVNGGTPPFSYLWNTVPPQTTATITGLVAGNYSIMVLDANTCTHTLSINVTQPAILAANITSTPTLCNGGSNGTATSNTTGGTSPYTYAWSNGQTTATATGLVVGSYTVTVTDNNGCSVGASVTVNQPSLMTASANGTNLTCPGISTGSANVGVFGGNPPFTYAWSNGQTGFNATGLAAGTHTVTVTDNNGCTAIDSVALTEPPDLIVGLTVTDVACNGGSDGAITAAASGGTGGLSYSWSNAQTGTTITTLSNGSYTVTVTDVNNCTVTATGVVNEPAALSISLTAANLTCNTSGDGAITAGVTGGTTPYSYAWSNGATTAGVTGLAIGSYTVTVTDANGCSTASGTTLTEPAALVANATAGSVSCFAGADGSAATTATGGTAPYTYAWTGGQATANATGLTAGPYTVTLTDANGCSTTATVTVTEPPDLLVAVAGVDLLCNGINTGTATATPSGGTSPYTYAWSNAQATAVATGLAAGPHTVTVTDNNGCTETAAVTLTQPALLAVTIAVQDVSCQGGNDGSIAATPAGGTGSYTYAWSNGQTTASVNGLAAGSLVVTVTDANGCTTTGAATVTEPAALAVSLIPTDLTCNGSNDGTIASTVTGGTSPYSYGWSNGQAAATAIN